MQWFEVGGCVRDDILGRKPKDIDFVVVLDEDDKLGDSTPFKYVHDQLVLRGFEIRNAWEPFGTLKAQRQGGFTFGDRTLRGVYDFVVARKEVGGDGRYPDRVEAGTLEDDLRRRDFTMNAIARSADGSLIDPFGGLEDIQWKRIAAVGDAVTRFREDHLRILRAQRFKITMGFDLTLDIIYGIKEMVSEPDLFAKVSDERIREELDKMFRADTPYTLQSLHVSGLDKILFNRRVWLKPTTEGR